MFLPHRQPFCNSCVFPVSSTSALTETALICFCNSLFKKYLLHWWFWRLSLQLCLLWIFRAMLSFSPDKSSQCSSSFIISLSWQLRSPDHLWIRSLGGILESPLSSLQGNHPWIPGLGLQGSYCIYIFTTLQSCLAHPLSLLLVHSTQIVYFSVTVWNIACQTI